MMRWERSFWVGASVGLARANFEADAALLAQADVDACADVVGVVAVGDGGGVGCGLQLDVAGGLLGDMRY
jgi:hypothetical protein